MSEDANFGQVFFWGNEFGQVVSRDTKVKNKGLWIYFLSMVQHLLVANSVPANFVLLTELLLSTLVMPLPTSFL